MLFPLEKYSMVLFIFLESDGDGKRYLQNMAQVLPAIEDSGSGL